MERDAGKPLKGRVEVDDAFGGERPGGKRGRGAPGKTPIVAAVETTPDGRPVRLKLCRAEGFRRKAVERLSRRCFLPGSTVCAFRGHPVRHSDFIRSLIERTRYRGIWEELSPELSCL